MKASNIASKMCYTAHQSTLPHVYVLEKQLSQSLYFTVSCLSLFFFLFLSFLPLQLCVRIEKNPGLGFSISGGISGQGNPFKPSDMVRSDRACQPIPAASALHSVTMETAACFPGVSSICLTAAPRLTWLTLIVCTCLRKQQFNLGVFN